MSARPASARACTVVCACALIVGGCAPIQPGTAESEPASVTSQSVQQPSPTTSNASPGAVPTPTPAQVGTPAASQRKTFTPHGIRIIGSGSPATVRPMDTDATGHVVLPPDPGEVGWWLGGALAGDPFGSVVLGGHIDSRRFGLGFFARLLDVNPGDRIELTGDGLALRYRVQSTGEVAKDALATTAQAFDMDTPGRLVLITCTGRFDPSTHHYDRNLVVVATPEGLPAPS